MFDKKFLKIFGVLCFSLVVLAGCRPEEQGRPLNYEAGVYPGKAPTSSISQDDLAELRQRSLLQGGIPAGGSGSGSGGGPTTGTNVRPPVNETDANKVLQERGKLQSGN